jgi:hypothetical protein
MAKTGFECASYGSASQPRNDPAPLTIPRRRRLSRRSFFAEADLIYFCSGAKAAYLLTLLVGLNGPRFHPSSAFSGFAFEMLPNVYHTT